MLPMLMGKGQEDIIRNQIKTTRGLAMQRGGFSFLKLFSKALPTIKEIGIPLAVDTLSSMRDKAISKAIGEGRFRNNRPKLRRLRRPPRKSQKSSPPSFRSIRKRKFLGSNPVKTSKRPVQPSRRPPQPSKRPVQPSSRLVQPSRRRLQQSRRSVQSSRTPRRKGKRALVQGLVKKAASQLPATGRRLFDNVRLPKTANIRQESTPLPDTPFAQKLRESIRTATSRTTADSSHIGQSFNI